MHVDDNVLVTEGTITRLHARIRELEAETGRMRPVVDAALARVKSLRKIHPDGWTRDEDDLVREATIYESSKPK